MEAIFIRKVELNMNEQIKYEVIKKLVETNGNKRRAAMTLDLSIRQINRLIKGYIEFGKAFFIHGNRGSKPANTISEQLRKLIVDLYKTKYSEANFTHYAELLQKFENINLSVSAISSILEKEYILSPRVTKAKQKKVKKDLLDKLNSATSRKESNEIQSNLVAVEDAHVRRPRCAYFGELLQMDASPYSWFGCEVSSLHIAVDDATGMILGAWFDKEETLSGYYNIFHQILTNYGIPYEILTDRRTVFTYKQKNSPSLDEDSYTQFAYACKQLGVSLKCTSVPQAKGRVERMFETLQSRLPIELRLAGATNIKTANEFLNSYIKEFNAKFALPANSIKSVFEVQPSNEKINLILAILTERTVDSGHCIQFQNKYFRMIDKNGNPIHYHKGTKVMVIQAYDKQQFCCVNDKEIYSLEEIPKQQITSKEFDLEHKEIERKPKYIPPMSHPWKRQSFERFVRSQKHYAEGNPKTA